MKNTVKSRFDRIEQRTDLPLSFLALLIVPALVVEDRAQSLWMRDVAVGINWVVWLAFCAEFAGKLIFAPSRIEYLRRAWFDLLIILLSPPFLVPLALQWIRAVRVLRLLRLVRAAAVAAIGLREAGQALRHRSFHYVLLVTFVVIALGAAGIFAAEHGQNKAIQSVGDAFWWAIVTTTTVGYGDVSPVTGEGRLIAVGLMFLGIGFIGVFTATITSFFLSPGGAEQDETVEHRLDRIEAKLDALMQRGGHDDDRRS